MAITRKNVGNDKDEWGTPDWLFNLLNKEARFTGDVAATEENAKCKQFFTKKDDALSQDWFKRNFLNPPYSARLVSRFMQKARLEANAGAVVWCLIRVASDTQWWHRNVMEAQEIRFIEGRVDYVGVDLEGNKITQSPTFSSCVVIFDKKKEKNDLVGVPCQCGLDEPCEEGYTKWEGQKCSCGYRDCYNDDFPPVIGETIKVPKKEDR